MDFDAADFGAVRRKGVKVTQEGLVTVDQFTPIQTLPLLVRPRLEGVNLAVWARNNRQLLEGWLHKHGAVLFRGFGVGDVVGFEGLARAVSHDLLDYRERSSPRTEISRGIYTSTDHPADQHIHFHNEQSYTKRWPMKLWFYCEQPARQGGATPIADGRRVLQRLSPSLKNRFLQNKVTYVRNYSEGMGLSWQTAFQTTNTAEVEAYCKRTSLDFEWKDGDRLRTKQTFDTIVTHPKTGEDVWFEHAAFFHVSSVPLAMRNALFKEFKKDDLPFNTYFGDGSPIEDSVLDEIREAYEHLGARFSWQKHDVLLIDNMLTSHARDPFVGPRKIVVAMSELYPDQPGTPSGAAERSCPISEISALPDAKV